MLTITAERYRKLRRGVMRRPAEVEAIIVEPGKTTFATVDGFVEHLNTLALPEDHQPRALWKTD